MKSRIVLVFLFMVGLWGVLISRGLYLQVFENEKLERQKQKQFSRTITVPGKRGRIFDRHGQQLSVSIATYSLFADPKLIDQPQVVSRKISKLLKLPYRKLLSRLQNKKRRFAWVKRNLDKKTRDEIREWGVRGLGFVEEAKRVYPNGAVASQVIGSVNRDGRGIEGLEKQFDAVLKGKKITVPIRRDARGRPLLLNGEWREGVIDGQDIVTTLDRDLQFFVEEELERTVNQYEAESAVAVVLDVKDSQVLAMANFPTYNPEEKGLRGWSRWQKNRVVTDAFEPGSTLKSILVASAVEEMGLAPGKKYFCENGKFKIGRRTIREADSRHHYGWLTVAEILSKSSNIGTSKISFELGDAAYRKTLVDLGFGQKTGILFPGETRGILHQLPWREHLLANTSFGHGIATTPLQMALAYAAIARGGVWQPPQLVREVQDHLGTPVVDPKVKVHSQTQGRRVFSKETAKKMTMILTAVTGAGGTGLNARVPGFLVAGKTGTAQKVDPNGRGYLRGAYISSFAGFVPAHDPKYVIYIAVDNPKKVYYGSTVAAPVFSNVASYALRKNGVEPTLLSENNLVEERDQLDEKVKKALTKLTTQVVSFEKVPRLKGMTMREVSRLMHTSDVELQFIGRGVVEKTVPSQGEKLASDKRLKVIFSATY